MAFGLSTLKQLFEGDPAVRRVAGDPTLSAEILLLFRMVLADGEVQEAELTTLKRICRDSFGIGEEGFAQVMRHLKDHGDETSAGQALELFSELPRERRAELARHMAEIAKADRQLSQHEVRLLARTLEILRLSPEDLIPRP